MDSACVAPGLEHPPSPLHCRESQALSVRGESIPEERFCRSLCRAVGMWPGARLVDYICVESALLGECPQNCIWSCPGLCQPPCTMPSPGLPVPTGAGGCRRL